jgi:L-threonylcarbamoyladenylate synthase
MDQTHLFCGYKRNANKLTLVPVNPLTSTLSTPDGLFITSGRVLLSLPMNTEQSSSIQALHTQMVAVDPRRPDPDILRRAGAIVRAGGLVAFPTETVYGLGANALDAVAVAHIFEAKQRPAHDPVIVHVADVGELERIAERVPAIARELAARFWPGPLTLVLPKAEIVPDVVTAGGSTVAVRCPNHPLALALIRAADTPIAAPSANRFSRTSPTAAQHVWDDLAGRIDMILDGGPTSIGVESTVLDVSGERPVILRPGGVTAEELAAALGHSLAEPGTQKGKAGATLASPGMLGRHYAPRTPLWLFSGSTAAIHAAMRAEIEAARARGQRVALMLAAEDGAAFSGTEAQAVIVGPLDRPDEVARNLFQTMRTLDAAGVDLILARDFPPVGLGQAVRDRLRRAAAHIINL